MEPKDIIELKRFSKNAAEFANRIEKSFDYNLPRDGDPTASTGVWEEEIKAFADAQTLKNLFFSEDWVYICVDLAANKLSSVPLGIVRKDVNADGQLIAEPVHDHALMPLILMPNPWQEYPSWMYNYVVEDTLMGNAINWFAEQNGHLIILPADQVTVHFDNKNQIDQYKLSVRTADQAFLSSQKQPGHQTLSFPVDQIIHTRRPNPASLLWGLSPFTPGRKPVLFNRYTSDYLNSFYLKQATPAMAITMDRTVNEDLALRQLASFEMAYSGRKNARRTLMLPKGTDAKPMTHTLADQRLVDMIEKNREVIINLLKVPKHELGLQTAGSLGSEEHKIALRNFWEATLIPMSKRIEGTLTQFFRRKQMLADDEFFAFDISEVDALKDDMLKKAEIAKEMAQTLPLNTVIQKVWEEEPIEDERADLPLSLAPTGGVSVSASPEEVEEAVEPVEEERSLLAGNDPDSEENRKAVMDHLVKNRAAPLKRIDRSFSTILENEGGAIEERSLDLFVDMAAKAIKVMRETLKEKSGTAPALKAPVEDPDMELLLRRLQKAFDDLEEGFVEDYREVLAEVIERGYGDMISFGFDEAAIEQIEALRARDANGRKAILTARGIDSFAHISKTRSTEIVTEIANGIAKNENLGDLTERVANKFKDKEANINRARTIAHTESLTAASIGQIAAFENVTEVMPKAEKVWVNTGDLRVRGRPDGKYPDSEFDHWKVQGQRRQKGKKFSNGLQYPRDLNAKDPGNVIRCRCSLIILPPGEKIEGL